MARLRNTTSGALRLRVMPALLILALWTASAAAFTGPRYMRGLFDLSIEELMEIRIAAEWGLGCWPSPDDGAFDTEQCDIQAASNDASQPSGWATPFVQRPGSPGRQTRIHVERIG